MAQFDLMISFSLIFNLLLVLCFYYFFSPYCRNNSILNILKNSYEKFNRTNRNLSFLNRKKFYRFNHHCYAPNNRRWYSSSTPLFMDPITISTIFKSTAAITKSAGSCPTPVALYPDINIWNYMGSVVKGTITDLTAPLLWKFIFSACSIFLISYGVASIYIHAVEIYQIVQFYKQIANSPELVALLNHQYELLNHFNHEAAIAISKLTFKLLSPDDCQIIVKYCIYSSEYKFHDILMDISNSNKI